MSSALLAGTLLLTGCGGGGGGGGGTAPAAFATLGGAVVKGITQFGRITADELDNSGSVVRTLGTAVTDAQGRYSLDLPASYTGGPILLTLSDNADPAQPTTVVCDVQGGCGTFAFGQSMPIGALVLTALHPGTSVSGATVSMQVTGFTHAAAQTTLNLGLALDAALVQAVNDAIGGLLGGVDLANVEPVDITDPTALAAASPAERLYAYLSAAIAGLGFGQAVFSGAPDPLAAVVDALAASLVGGTAVYDDGGDPNTVSLQELFAQALAETPAGDTETETALTDADAAAAGGDHDILPDTDGDGIRDYADACPNDADNDADGDGVCGDVDVCPGFDDTLDADGDGTPDGCDVCPDDADNDADADGICAGTGFSDPKTGDADNCPAAANPTQADTDGDGAGDACDACPDDADNDSDGDGICTGAGFVAPATGGNDNCPSDANADQADTDSDGLGDACDACPLDPANDADGDGVCGDVDVCPGFDDTLDADGDGTPDGCDVCPGDATNDADADGICAGTGFSGPKTGDGDNCPAVANPGQADGDADGLGDPCDICPADVDNDSDGDGICTGASFNAPATGTLDNCPSDANPGQLDTDSDGAGDVCDLCPSDPTDACAVDTDGDGIFDPVDVCPLDTDNDSDGDGVCVGSDFNSPATAGDDNCPDVANPDQADGDGNGVGDACETPIVTIGSVSFDTAESADLAAHPLVIPTQSPWLFARYDGTPGAFGILFSQTTNRGVPVTELVVTEGAGGTSVYDLARATDGALYALYARETDGGSTAEVTPDDPLLFLPASLSMGTTWPDDIGAALWGDDPPATLEVTGVGVTSPAGYTGTIEVGFSDSADTQYWRTGNGLVDLADGAAFRRADVSPVPGSLIPTTGTHKTINPGDTWTYLEVGGAFDADGRTDPDSAYASLTTILVQDRTVTEPTGLGRTARVVWIDVATFLPGIGEYDFFTVGYFNQNGDLRDLGANGSWIVAPEEGAIFAPGTMSVGQTFGDTYDDGFETGVETFQVVQGNVGVQTPEGNFQTFRILYSDMPVPGDPRPWSATSTEWYSPSAGTTIQSIGDEVDTDTGAHFPWAEQIVDSATVPGSVDSDGDGVPDITDNCLHVPNAGQEDVNSNGIGDTCDFFLIKPAPAVPEGARHHGHF